MSKNITLWDLLYVTSTRKVTPIKDNLVNVSYKSMGYYEAIPLNYGDERSELGKKKKEEENNQYGEQFVWMISIYVVEERNCKCKIIVLERNVF